MWEAIASRRPNRPGRPGALPVDIVSVDGSGVRSDPRPANCGTTRPRASACGRGCRPPSGINPAGPPVARPPEEDVVPGLQKAKRTRLAVAFFVVAEDRYGHADDACAGGGVPRQKVSASVAPRAAASATTK